MHEYVNAISPVVSGIFLVIVAILGWKLKTSTDKRELEHAKEKERRDELKVLYTAIFVVMEQTINRVRAGEKFSLEKELSEVNAKVRLLASSTVEDLYCEAAVLVEEWSALHVKATIHRTKIGDQWVEVFQAPDPTLRFKQPAADAYERLQSVLETLVAQMRVELRNS